MKKHGFDIRTIIVYLFSMALIMGVLKVGKIGYEVGISNDSNSSLNEDSKQ